MYAFIEGRVCEKTTNSLVLEAGGIGYQLNCSMTTLQEAPPMGEKNALLYLPFRPRRRDGTLRLRNKGGKAALPFAHGHQRCRRKNRARPARRYAPARLEPRDSAGGCQRPLPRAGHRQKKTAQRIALELKDKVTQADINQPTGKTATPTSGAAADNFAEAIEALTALGYSAIEARDALSHVEDKDAPADELIRLALRAMAGM